MNYSKRILIFFLLSFIEGGIMFVTELASTRKIAVFFGSSLYVWLIVLCITLIAMAVGYFWANQLLQKNNQKSPQTIAETTLSNLFFVLALTLALWKFNANFSLFLIHQNFGLLSSVILDALFLLAIPMFASGAITTLIVAIVQKQHTTPLYGKILAFSTLGSVVFAVIAVLVTFPYIGVQTTMYLFSIIALLIAILLKKINYLSVILFIIITMYPEKKLRVNVLYQNDGAFSSVMVAEQNRVRYLLVNYIIQSFEDYATGKTLKYADIIDSVLQLNKQEPKKILILGLGGGIIANKLAQHTTDITGVEIDPRIIDCAKKYFNLNKSVKAVCEDAQWFIQKDTSVYDVIIMDMFNGEEPPAYLLTKENFSLLKNHLKNKNSFIIINWYGYYSGKLGKGTRVLANTLNKSGLHVSALPTSTEEDHSNLIFFASENKSILPSSKITLIPDNEINTADKNILSSFNAPANFNWRKNYLNFIKIWWGN